MRMVRRLCFPALLLTLALVMAACGPAATPTPTPKPAAPATSPGATPTTAAATTPGTKPTTAPATTPAPKTSSAAPDAAAMAALYEAAKKEGKVTAWTTVSDDNFVKFVQPFKARYPGIEVENWRSNGAGIAEKILAEHRVGKYTVDVIGSADDGLTEYKKEGLLLKYDYPSQKDLPAEWRDPEGLWGVNQINFEGLIYHTKLVPAAEAPKKWEDLYDPKWKGNVGMKQDGEDLAVALWKFWGKEKTIDLLQKLAANQPTLIRGSSTQIQMMAAGQFKVADAMLLVTLQAMNDGAPLDWVRINPMIGRVSNMAIAAKAPHPNAAKLYVEWWQSPEGQKAYNDAGYMAPKGATVQKVTTGSNLGTNLVTPGAPFRDEAIDAYQTILKTK